MRRPFERNIENPNLSKLFRQVAQGAFIPTIPFTFIDAAKAVPVVSKFFSNYIAKTNTLTEPLLSSNKYSNLVQLVQTNMPKISLEQVADFLLSLIKLRTALLACIVTYQLYNEEPNGSTVRNHLIGLAASCSIGLILNQYYIPDRDNAYLLGGIIALTLINIGKNFADLVHVISDLAKDMQQQHQPAGP